MNKIKICGLSRMEDIAYVNEAKPDYAGFIIHFPKSHRNVDCDRLQNLRRCLDRSIKAVGVFVNQPEQDVIQIAKTCELDLIQLHGTEDESYIQKIQKAAEIPVIKAFQIRTEHDLEKVETCSADYILLDAGQGAGKVFDWTLLKGIQRSYFLAGGISADNIEEAIRMTHPFALDLSSGVETEKMKDRNKILEVVNIAHKEEK